MQDWLSDEQLELRRSREVQSVSGARIDRLIFSGIYRRAYNPLAGTRPTRQGRFGRRQDPWRQDAFEAFGWTDAFIPSWSRADRMVEGGEHYTWDIMLPHQCGPVRLSLTEVEVFQADRWVWECPDCTCENYFDSGEDPAPCQYCGITVVRDK